MRVLGIDPGLTRCGFGVVDGRPGQPPTMVDVDVVRTPPELDTARRLVQLEVAVEEWVRRHRPDAVAVERVFAQHNVQTVMGTAQAAGIAMLVAARHGLPVALHTPSEVKASITGSGRAGKDQVGAMVTRILRLTEMPRPADAADALALAICHVWRGGVTSRPQEASEGRARLEAQAQAQSRLQVARLRADALAAAGRPVAALTLEAGAGR